MTRYYAAIVCIVFSCSVITQSTFAQRGRPELYPPSANEDRIPIIVVDTFTTDPRHLLLEAENIASVDLVKNSKIIAAYGQKASKGVILVKPKKNTKIVSLTGLLDQFNVPVADRHLHVCVDKVAVPDATKLVADKDHIESVEIITATPAVAGVEERHINIVTRKSR
jgi:hypothetical protein